jgi:hypothetical protein
MNGRTSPFSSSLRSLLLSVFPLSLLFLSPHTSQDEPS